MNRWKVITTVGDELELTAERIDYEGETVVLRNGAQIIAVLVAPQIVALIVPVEAE